MPIIFELKLFSNVENTGDSDTSDDQQQQQLQQQEQNDSDESDEQRKQDNEQQEAVNDLDDGELDEPAVDDEEEQQQVDEQQGDVAGPHDEERNEPATIRQYGKKCRTRYVCVCRKEFDSKKKIGDHITSVHGGDRYVCTICYMQAKNPARAWFKTKKALLTHCNRVQHDIPDINEPIRNAVFLKDSDESQDSG